MRHGFNRARMAGLTGFLSRRTGIASLVIRRGRNLPRLTPGTAFACTITTLAPCIQIFSGAAFSPP
jgi:hypothetical protein